MLILLFYGWEMGKKLIVKYHIAVRMHVDRDDYFFLLQGKSQKETTTKRRKEKTRKKIEGTTL